MTDTVLLARTPRPTPTEWAIGGGVLALGVAALLPVHHIEDGPVICPFRRLTGLPCPGCGLTRSWTYLLHGWWHDAFWSNPFGPPLAIAVVVLAALAVRRRLRGMPAPDFERIAKHPAAMAVWAVWAVFGVVRMIHAA